MGCPLFLPGNYTKRLYSHSWFKIGFKILFQSSQFNFNKDSLYLAPLRPFKQILFHHMENPFKPLLYV